MAADDHDLPAVRDGPRSTQSLEIKNSKGVVGRLNPKLKKALDLVVWEGKDAFDAAREVGMHPQAMRKALNRAPVIQFLREERQVFREALRASNMHIAREIRDNGSNDAARVRCLAYIDGDMPGDGGGAGGRKVQPGVVVQIVVNSGPVPHHDEVIEVNPAGDRDAADH